MPDEKEEKVERDPIEAFGEIEDEELRSKPQPEPEINDKAPEDPKAKERNEDGTFKGKEGEKKPDAKAKDDAKEKPEQRKDEHVPLAKYLEEKNKLRAELDQRELTLKEFQKKIADLEAKLPKAEPEKEPDFIEDPKAYVDHKLSKTLEQIEAHNKRIEDEGKKAQETASQASEQVQLQRFMQDLQTHEQRFVAQNPDYHDALNHVRQIRAYQLEQFHPGITREQIIDTIRQEEINLAATLARAGKDPVQTAYELAQRYGYQKKAPQNQQQQQPPKGQLPPDQSMGGGGGNAPDNSRSDAEEDAAEDMVAKALESLTRRRA